MTEIYTDRDGEWAECRGTPLPGERVFYYSEATDALHPADVWLWQTGNIWRAEPLHEVNTWWDGSAGPRAEGAPIDWCLSISDIPESGTCYWFGLDLNPKG